MSQRKSSFGKVNKGAKVRGSVFTSAIVVEGYLKKHSTGIIKRWQKRYFAVKGHYLNYYENENMGDKQLKGTIDLEKLQAAGLTQADGEIQLIVDGESIMLHADDRSEAKRWVDALKQFELTANPMARSFGSTGSVDRGSSKQKRGSAVLGTTMAGVTEGGIRPLGITIGSATGLKPMKDGSSDPMVIVTVVTKSGESAMAWDEQQLQMMSSVAGHPQKVGGPLTSVEGGVARWNETLLLPGIEKGATIYFTAVNWGKNGELTFLGQGSVKTDDETMWKVAEGAASRKTKASIVLDKPIHTPQDGMGKALTLEGFDFVKTGDASVGQWTYQGGSLDVTMMAYDPSYAICGEMGKTGGDRYTSVWKSRWLLLSNKTLYYYSFYGDPKPKYTIDLGKATAIEHPENVLEMITVQMPDKLWQFKAPDVLLGGEWWWKLRQAANIKTKEDDKGKGVALAQTEHAKKTVRRSVMSM